MGCGGCQMSSIQSPTPSLSTLLQRKISSMLALPGSFKSSHFLSIEEIKEINNTPIISESLNPDDIRKFLAGEGCLLSRGRRLVWKAALWRPQGELGGSCQFEEEVRQPVHEATKNRFTEIGLDINRTFPTNGSLSRPLLTLTLQNITLHFQGVGYTQGMNFFAGFFLLCGFSPRQAFQLFVRLSTHPRFALIRNFTEGFKNVNLCVGILQKKMTQHANLSVVGVKNKIQQLGLNTFFYSFSWFLSYMLYNLELQSCVQIWDFILLHTPPLHPQQSENPILLVKAKVISPLLTQGECIGGGLINLLSFTLVLIEYLSDELLQSFDMQSTLAILRHDSIQKRITPDVVYDLVSKAKRDGMSIQEFVQDCQSVDPQLLDIMGGLELISNETKGGEEANRLKEIAHNFIRQSKIVNRVLKIGTAKAEFS